MAAAMIPPAAAHDFLANAGWGGAKITPLAGDASFRRYFRVTCGDRRAALMDAPPPHEDPRPFLAVARYLHEQGFAAPAIFAENLDLGLVLLEDFGDVRMREAIDAREVDERETYAATVDLLVDLHRVPAASLAPHDPATLALEVELVTEWYCPAAGVDIDLEGYRHAWSEALGYIDMASPVTVLRDYHAENIMLRSGQSGRARLGLLDFQDAVIGHRAYDLVSMLQDARRDVAPEIEAEMVTRYVECARPASDFEASYAILGAQRNARIVGVFARLWQRDGKPRYLDFLPRVWGYLERDLEHPALDGVRAWFDTNVPKERRGGFLTA